MKNEVLNDLKIKLKERKEKEYNKDLDNHIYRLFFDFLQSLRTKNNCCIICNNEIVETITLDNEFVYEIYCYLDDSEYTGQNKNLQDLFSKIYDLFDGAFREFWNDEYVLEGKTTFNFKKNKYNVDITDEYWLCQCELDDAIDAWVERQREEEEVAKEYT